MKEPMGNIIRTVPSCASLSWNASLIEGMREAQLEKISPQKKKNTATV